MQNPTCPVFIMLFNKIHDNFVTYKIDDDIESQLSQTHNNYNSDNVIYVFNLIIKLLII